MKRYFALWMVAWWLQGCGDPGPQGPNQDSGKVCEAAAAPTTVPPPAPTMKVAYCINTDYPSWCLYRGPMGVECTPPHQYPTLCVPAPNGPGGEIRFCCNVIDGKPVF